MKYGEIILMVLVIAMSTVPVWWLIRAGNTRKRNLIKALAVLSCQKKQALKHELWSNKIIAIDDRNILYYITADDDNNIQTQQVIYLNDVIKCSLSIESSGTTKQNPLTGRIDIIIHTGGKQNDVIPINIYDQANDDAFESGYFLQLGRRWEELIRTRILMTSIKTAA